MWGTSCVCAVLACSGVRTAGYLSAGGGGTRGGARGGAGSRKVLGRGVVLLTAELDALDALLPQTASRSQSLARLHATSPHCIISHFPLIPNILINVDSPEILFNFFMLVCHFFWSFSPCSPSRQWSARYWLVENNFFCSDVSFFSLTGLDFCQFSTNYIWP